MWTKITLLSFVLIVAVNGLKMPCHTCDTKNSPMDFIPSSGVCNFVQIEPCSAQPCPLKKGTKVKFGVSFTASQAAQNLTAEVYGSVMGIWVPFPLPNPNGCRDSGVQCPVAAGQTFTYQEELAIQSIFPSINVVVKWILKDQDKNPVFCVIVPAKIVP